LVYFSARVVGGSLARTCARRQRVLSSGPRHFLVVNCRRDAFFNHLVVPPPQVKGRLSMIRPLNLLKVRRLDRFESHLR
jgi:hypothetical protein